MSSINATEAQKSFGQIIDRAHGNEAIVVERYGRPRVVIVDYERYRELIACERDELRDRLRQASASAQARAAELSEVALDQLLEEARAEVHEGRG